MLCRISRISRRPDNTDSRMAAAVTICRIYPISRDRRRGRRHGHVTDRPVFFMSRGGGRGGRIRRWRPEGFRDGTAGNQRVPAGADLPSGEGAGGCMARGVSRNPSGKPRENRGKTAFPAPEISGNPGFPSHAGRRHARAGGGSGAGG